MAKIKLQKLKIDKIRKTIPLVIGGETVCIEVYNPIGESRTFLTDILKQSYVESVKEKNDIDITELKTLLTFYRELTNLEVESEEEIYDVLSSPSSESLLVASEISDIVHELVLEILINEKGNLKRLMVASEQADLEKGYKVLFDQMGISKDLDKIQKYIDDEKKNKEESVSEE